MIPFKLVTLGSQLDYKKYGILENNIYKDKNYYDLCCESFLKLKKDILFSISIIHTNVNQDSLVRQLTEKYGEQKLKGLNLHYVIRTTATPFRYIEYIKWFNATKEKPLRVQFIEYLNCLTVSALKELHQYALQQNVSLIIKEQVPYPYLK